MSGHLWHPTRGQIMMASSESKINHLIGLIMHSFQPGWLSISLFEDIHTSIKGPALCYVFFWAHKLTQEKRRKKIKIQKWAIVSS